MWHKILNIESTLFPAMKETLRLEELSTKESKLIRILDFAEIEKSITIVSVTNTKKDREHEKSSFCFSVWYFIYLYPSKLEACDLTLS